MRRSQTLYFAAGLAVLLIVVGLAAWLTQRAAVPAAAPAPSMPRVVSHQVTYEVLGDVANLTGGDTGGASITYNTASGDTAQEADRALPWRRTIAAPAGAFLYVAAQNSYKNGYILCRIYVDGRPVKETRSDGGYVIATCSLRLE